MDSGTGTRCPLHPVPGSWLDRGTRAGLFLFSSWLSKPLLLEKLPEVKVFNKHIELS